MCSRLEDWTGPPRLSAEQPSARLAQWAQGMTRVGAQAAPWPRCESTRPGPASPAQMAVPIHTEFQQSIPDLTVQQGQASLCSDWRRVCPGQGPGCCRQGGCLLQSPRGSPGGLAQVVPGPASCPPLGFSPPALQGPASQAVSSVMAEVVGHCWVAHLRRTTSTRCCPCAGTARVQELQQPQVGAEAPKWGRGLVPAPHVPPRPRGIAASQLLPSLAGTGSGQGGALVPTPHNPTPQAVHLPVSARGPACLVGAHVPGSPSLGEPPPHHSQPGVLSVEGPPGTQQRPRHLAIYAYCLVSTKEQNQTGDNPGKGGRSIPRSERGLGLTGEICGPESCSGLEVGIWTGSRWVGNRGRKVPLPQPQVHSQPVCGPQHST